MFNLLLLAPLVAAFPFHHPSPHPEPIPELSLQDWIGVQSGFVSGSGSGLDKATKWAFSKAAQAHEVNTQDDDDKTQETIWRKLKGDPDQFSRLTGLIEFVGGKPKEILDDGKLSITFFAPNNDALRPPEHHHGGHDHDKALNSLMATPDLASISTHYQTFYSPSSPLLMTAKHNHSKGHDDDDEHKRRKEIFKRIAAKVLAYHGLPKALTAGEVAQNSTLETGLKAEDGSFAGLHRRVRVEKTLIPPSVKLNFYARIISTDNKASNGIYHTISHPLIPPPSIFDSLYLFPDFFSTLTSAVQGSHGRHYLDWHYDYHHRDDKKVRYHDDEDKDKDRKGHGHFDGTPVASFFAPTNAAFALLPPRLKFYLFSPFGERALRKVLAYHYVPHSILFSEFQYHEKHDKKKGGVEEAMEEGWEGLWGGAVADDPSFHKVLEVHSGLPNATLKVEIDKTKIVPIEGAVKTTIKVNGQQVQTIDVPARNGAFHVLGKLLVPPHHHHHDHDHHGDDLAAENSWDNWEEWLPAWAEANDGF